MNIYGEVRTIFSRRRAPPPLLSSLSLSNLELSDTPVYEPYLRSLHETALHFCEEVVFNLRTVPIGTALSIRIVRVIRRCAQAMYTCRAAVITIFSRRRAPPPPLISERPGSTCRTHWRSLQGYLALKNTPPPFPRTTMGPLTRAYCRVLGKGCFL